MALPIGKLAPTAVVVAAVSCCALAVCLPGRRRRQAGRGDAGDRCRAAFAAHRAASRAQSFSAGRRARSLGSAKVAKTAPAAAKTGREAARPPQNPAARRARGKPPADPLSSLTLSATSILAEQRLAVINGRIYAERERLKSNDPSAPPCVVARILPDRVILECEGRTATLSYANVVRARKSETEPAALPSHPGTAPSPAEPRPRTSSGRTAAGPGGQHCDKRSRPGNVVQSSHSLVPLPTATATAD